jgi:glucose/arabinose dehydrogenase
MSIGRGVESTLPQPPPARHALGPASGQTRGGGGFRSSPSPCGRGPGGGVRRCPRTLPLLLTLPLLSGCGDRARLPLSAGIGPNPVLPPPHETLFPTVNIAPAKGWPAGATPIAAPDLRVTEYAAGLDHPRWVYVLPNNDVLVAETNAPPKPEDDTGLRGWIAKLVMRRAGAGVPSANRITLLRGLNPQGGAESRSVLLDGLNSPFGMALVGGDLYVADTDAVLRFPYRPGQTRITAPGARVAELPAGPINHHWTKSLIASPDGRRLYVTVGSNSNAGERGMAVEAGRAAIWEIDLRTGRHRVVASGLRNPNGLGWEPTTGALWTAVNERDGLGSDLVPDYMTPVRDGGFYGWPYSYFGQHLDPRVAPQHPDLVAAAIVPDYALGAHTASLGLAFGRPGALPARFANGTFIGQHGSWNRRPRSGYKVVFVPFAGGHPAGMPVDVLTGFLDTDGDALGRPVGLALDRSGALLVADDVGNRVWRVTASSSSVWR